MQISPSCLGLHYGQTIFEGLKAYRQVDGSISIFRPADNFERLNRSAERMCMPTIPVDMLVEYLKELVALDHGWVPKTPSSSLYIRPFMFATDEAIGVRPADTYRFIIFTGPAGPYYSAPIKVLVETQYTRAVKGGTGAAKAGGNYGGALLPTKFAQQKGYQQLIWTDAKEHRFIEESGTMNVMFQIGDSLLTPPAGETILKGITRDSVLTLARDMGVDVQERPVSMEEVAEGINTVKISRAMANHLGFRAPLTETIYEVLFGDKTAAEAVEYLMKFPYYVDVDVSIFQGK
jgi:branched-chain amino acid aminotransferase